MKFKHKIEQLSKEVNPPQVRLAYLAEDFDGISQYVLIQMSRASSSSAYAKVSIGGGSGKFPLEAGAKVGVIMVKGTLEVISLGG